MNVRFVPLLLLLSSVVGCDLDLFRLDDRTVISSYYLNRFESGSFYLWQNPDSGDPGWVVIDSQTDKITGPHKDDQLTSMNSAAGIQALDARDAWKQLGGS